MIDWEQVREAWREGLEDLGRKEESYRVAKSAGLVPPSYEDNAVSEKWWRDIIRHLFKQETGDGTTVAICVQPGFWKGSDECGYEEHNQDWNRLLNHKEAVDQKLDQKAAYIEARFHRSPERLPDLDYGDETDEDRWR